MRPRLREAGIVIGILPTGPLNASTDVPGVRVGHATLNQGDKIRTGITAILPHAKRTGPGADHQLRQEHRCHAAPGLRCARVP